MPNPQSLPRQPIPPPPATPSRPVALADEIGTLSPNKSADLAVWPITYPRKLSYWMGGLSPSAVWERG